MPMSAYERLPEICKGYVDAMIETCGCGSDAASWGNIDANCVGESLLKHILQETKRFHLAAARLHPTGTKEGLAWDIDDYDLGRGFYLIRQGAGVGFEDFDELGTKLTGLADRSHFIDISVTAEGKIDLV